MFSSALLCSLHPPGSWGNPEVFKSIFPLYPTSSSLFFTIPTTISGPENQFNSTLPKIKKCNLHQPTNKKSTQISFSKSSVSDSSMLNFIGQDISNLPSWLFQWFKLPFKIRFIPTSFSHHVDRERNPKNHLQSWWNFKETWVTSFGKNTWVNSWGREMFFTHQGRAEAHGWAMVARVASSADRPPGMLRSLPWRNVLPASPRTTSRHLAGKGSEAPPVWSMYRLCIHI